MLACHERLLWYAAEYNWSVAACVDKSVRQAIDATCRGGTRSLAQYYKSFDLWSGKASEAVLCGPESRSNWKSTYMVNKVAQQTDANQECKALLLDRTARMTARPELKIQADDVKVTHGAALSTTIDPKQLLYLISREVAEHRRREGADS
ncbi:hypothetical protein FOZ60_014036 [Perkinsus olseni]|uniref:SUF system FeS cluster assembly SufBD core domain-containing protein n=1 Tax=Perkinsus olseni TaxID=32597 RepID=A0A7J6N8I4_PEROL|nr:hypothetical protein FOZ60_014036 [Perkinsus olseni]